MKILFILGLTILVACTKNVNDACLDKILKEYNMVPYTGQDFVLGLIMLKCDDKVYYYIDDRLSDRTFDPFDCDGNFLARFNGDRNGVYSPENLEKYGFGTEKCKHVVVGRY